MSGAQLTRVQAISGTIFLMFAVVHLTNTAFAVGGSESYNGFQRVVRAVYQNPLVALSALYHGANGLIIALGSFGVRVPAGLRRGPGFWAPISASGLVLVVAVLALGGVIIDIADPTANPYAEMWNDLVGVDFGR